VALPFLMVSTMLNKSIAGLNDLKTIWIPIFVIIGAVLISLLVQYIFEYFQLENFELIAGSGLLSLCLVVIAGLLIRR
jgi:Flp pilus assembly protein protease CpaA